MRRVSDRIVDAAIAVRQETGLMGIPVPVYEIAEAVVDVFEEAFLPEGRDGMVIEAHGGMAIRVNANLRSRGRKRFTAGHELGHVRLHEGTFECLSRDVGSPAARDPREREANVFAAELLMPGDAFRRALGEGVPGLEAVRELAGRDRFDVSMTAAALRAVQVTDHQCVLVVSCRGRIEWSATSDTFEVFTRRSGPVPQSSATARVASSQPGSVLDSYDDATAWLDDRRVTPSAIHLAEEALALGEGRVLTLLTPGEEVDMDELDARRGR